MIELSPARYDAARHLFKVDYPNSPILFSVLEEHTPGEVYVDDGESPAWAIVVSSFGCAFVGGAIPQSALNEAIAELGKGRRLLLVRAPEDAIRFELPPGSTGLIDRLEFFGRTAPSSTGESAALALPDDGVFRRMDADLVERCLWREIVVRALGSVERFLVDGHGFCLMRGNEIMSEAYAFWLGAGRFEIGAITAEAYRGHGYGVATCRHMISLLEARGIETYWSCHRTNIASAATARRLGYQTERPYEWIEYRG